MTTFQTINPATEEVIKEWQFMPLNEAMSIAKSVAEAGKAWKALSINERVPYFINLADVFRENKQKYAEMMTHEMGKVIRESLAEVEKCAWLCEVLAENAEQWLREETVDADGVNHLITFEPLGVVYMIMPWNYPFWQPIKVGLLPLIAGNTLLLKHATNVTGSSMLIEDAIKKAGFPENVFRSIIIDHASSDALIDSNHIAACSLTGSVNSGSKVASRAGQNIKKTVLELGGSDPFIVCSDADLDAAARGAVTGRMGNAGQVCIGAKRIILHKDIANEFTEKFIQYTEELKMGDPLDPETQIGPVVDMKALEDMQAFTKDAVAKGAKVETGGERFGNKGAFYKPTILTQTSKEMNVVMQEVFGPVAPIIIVASDDEAITIANSSEFGLNGSVWTKDLAKGKAIARRLEAGGVFINHISASHPLLPLGGIKKSGYGRELGHTAIKEFVNVKAINVYE